MASIKRGLLTIVGDYKLAKLVVLYPNCLAVFLEDVEYPKKNQAEKKLQLHAGFPPIKKVALQKNEGTSSYYIFVDGFNKKGLAERIVLEVVGEKMMRGWVQAIRRASRPLWSPDLANCEDCGSSFSVSHRRHHCRVCGWCVCDSCLHGKVKLNDLAHRLKHPVCRSCHRKAGINAEGTLSPGDLVLVYKRYAGILIRIDNSVAQDPQNGKSKQRGKSHIIKVIGKSMALHPTKILASTGVAVHGIGDHADVNVVQSKEDTSSGERSEVRADSAFIERYSLKTLAATIITNACRGYLAHKAMNRKMYWKGWNTLDNFEEHFHLEVDEKLRNGREALKAHFQRKRSSLTDRDRTASQAVLHANARNVRESLVNEMYHGAHLVWPLTEEVIKGMMAAFTHGQPLHYHYVEQLLEAVGKKLIHEPVMNELTVKSGCTLTLVGDLHGQYSDLLTIFKMQGLPSKKNWYLFNGDFVDRGSFGVEVVLTLFAFKILYPDAVFLNRGNHESRQQNNYMGFEANVLTTYDAISTGDPECGRRIFALFEDAFDMLPLCATINKRVFVVHGGISDYHDAIDLQTVRNIDRLREPPIGGDSEIDQAFVGLLWSDPKHIMNGCFPSSRGAGSFWGPDVTKRFCDMNDIDMIIRSHECVMEGFESCHEGRVITLFSASRYCGKQDNRGGIITIDENLVLRARNFFAETAPGGEVATRGDSKEAIQKLEKDLIRMLAELILRSKAKLYKEFNRKDVDGKGYVSAVTWASVLGQVLRVDLPFLWYKQLLLGKECLSPEGQVQYTQFLSRYRIDVGENENWTNSVVSQIRSRLLKAVGGGDVKAIFAEFDADGNGEIDFSEFMQTLKRLEIGLSEVQMYELMRAFDTNGDGRIDYGELEDRFRIVYTKTVEDTDGNTREEVVRPTMVEGALGDRLAAEWAVTTLSEIGSRLYSKYCDNLEDAFNEIDMNGDGLLSKEEMETAFRGLGFDFTMDEVQKLMSVIGVDDADLVHIAEFVKSFKVQEDIEPTKEGKAPEWHSSIVQEVANVLYQHREHLKGIFQIFDGDGDGIVDSDDFKKGMEIINTDLDNPLTETQIRMLMDDLDADGDGVISYREFFDGFSIKLEGDE